MHLSNEVVLRPRFSIELSSDNQSALAAFEKEKDAQKDFVISRIDDHVFIRIPKNKQHFWSPQLHLEIIEGEEDTSKLHGLFGPNPAVWTMFMFLHFAVILLFLGFGVWAYSNYSLGDSYSLQLVIMFVLIGGWFALYLAGRLGKSAGHEEMMAQYKFMRRTLQLD